MAHFVVQPCHLRGAVFAPNKGEPALKWTWRDLVEQVAPAGQLSTLTNLRTLKPGAFVGLARVTLTAEETRTFLLLNTDRSARLDWILKRNPDFADRLVSVYRVDEVKWDDVTQEFDTPGLPPWGQQ